MVDESHYRFLFSIHFAELSTKLKLAEEIKDVLSKQIQDYKSKCDDGIRISQEKEKLASPFFLFRAKLISIILSSLLSV